MIKSDKTCDLSHFMKAVKHSTLITMAVKFQNKLFLNDGNKLRKIR